jgi:hypothetical protein
VGVHQPWKTEQALPVKNFFSLSGWDFWGDPGELAILYAQIQHIDPMPVWADNAHIFDHKVKWWGV